MDSFVVAVAIMALAALTATQTLDVETAVCLRRASGHSQVFVVQHLPHPIPRGPTLLLPGFPGTPDNPIQIMVWKMSQVNKFNTEIQKR